ncbi:hypothetical protein [Pedobacter sp. KLB.chiD]|uniref:hypothetical protein n=1 Tax=Pedobacter sp. KLB.chiD TaxID=3387402 RepID=UPI00399AF1D9
MQVFLGFYTRLCEKLKSYFLEKQWQQHLAQYSPALHFTPLRFVFVPMRFRWHSQLNYSGLPGAKRIRLKEHFFWHHATFNSSNSLTDLNLIEADTGPGA